MTICIVDNAKVFSKFGSELKKVIIFNVPIVEEPMKAKKSDVIEMVKHALKCNYCKIIAVPWVLKEDDIKDLCVVAKVMDKKMIVASPFCNGACLSVLDQELIKHMRPKHCYIVHVKDEANTISEFIYRIAIKLEKILNG